jgi:hypothetical protein
VLGALAQDRQPRPHVGSRDVGHQAGLEALQQALLQRLHVAGKSVRREHELAAGVVQGVERVEELLLGARLVLQELDVVHQQHVHAPIGGLEAV